MQIVWYMSLLAILLHRPHNALLIVLFMIQVRCFVVTRIYVKSEVASLSVHVADAICVVRNDADCFEFAVLVPHTAVRLVW